MATATGTRRTPAPHPKRPEDLGRAAAARPATRSLRSAAIAPTPTPAVILPGQAHSLDLCGLPIRFIDSVIESRVDTYACLFEADVLPALERLANESASQFVERACIAMAQRYDAALMKLDIDPCDPDSEEGFDTPVHLQDRMLILTLTADYCGDIDITAFEQTLLPHDPTLVRSLIDGIERYTLSSSRVFGPVRALEIGEYVMFWGCFQDWWEHMRDEASEERGTPEASDRDVRRYLRKHRIPTPWDMRRKIGRHYRTRQSDYHRAQRPGWFEQHVEQRVAALPKALRQRVTTIVEHIGALETHEYAIERAERICGMRLEREPSPGLCLDNEHGMVREVLDELWQDVAQGDGFGPVIKLGVTNRRDARCAKHILDHVNEAYKVTNSLIATLCAWK